MLTRCAHLEVLGCHLNRPVAKQRTRSRVNRASAEWYRHRVELVDAGTPGFRETLGGDTKDVYRQQPAEVGEGLLIRRQTTAEPRGYANAYRAMATLHGDPLDPCLSCIAAPTTILAGELDRHCPPRASETIPAGIAGSKLRVLPGVGHPIRVEQPEAVVAAVKRLSAEAPAPGNPQSAGTE